MAKAAISVTLDRANLAWLETHARASRARSLSQALDDLVTAARTARDATSPARSIVGDVSIAADDPDLSRADDVVRALFAASLGRADAGAKRRASTPSRRQSRRRG